MKKPLPHEETQIRQFAIEGIIKGYSHSELLEIIQKDYPDVEASFIETYIRGGIIKIRELTLVDLDKIIPIHIEIYEKIYKEFDELYSMQGKLRAMRQKEMLVGMHKEINTTEIHNEIDLEIETDPTYDMSRLSQEDQVKLEGLLKRVLDK